MISARNHGGPSDDASNSNISGLGNTNKFLGRSPGVNITPTSRLTRTKLMDSSDSGSPIPKKVSHFDRAKTKNELSRRDLSARVDEDDSKEEQ